jgi:serine/threonine-protein kinase
MNTAGSSQRSPSLPKASDSGIRAEDALGIDQRVEPDDQTVISQRPPLPANAVERATGALEVGKLLAGERLNHFELIEYVGGGGMGAVFRALDTMLNREVALKVLSRDQGSDDETRRRFQNEAQAAARLDHENIARVYYVGEDKGLNYIVFEFIEGVNLRESVEKRGPLPLAEAISYTLQIAEALAHACSRNVVHRDIKPSNVIITEDGRAKLVDMGLARSHHVQADGEDLTASGVTLGTFDYISPEQARDPRIADVRSDIYSLGCTVYYMLTGRPPFPEGTVLQKLLQHNSDTPPDPRELNPDLPLELSEVIRKMLAKDPRRRFQHPSELITELYLLAELIGCPAPSPARQVWLAPPPPRMSPVERHLPWIITVASLLAIVFLLDRWQVDEPPGLTATRNEVRPPESQGPRSVEKGLRRGAQGASVSVNQSSSGAGGAKKPAPTEDSKAAATPLIEKTSRDADAAEMSNDSAEPSTAGGTQAAENESAGKIESNGAGLRSSTGDQPGDSTGKIMPPAAATAEGGAEIVPAAKTAVSPESTPGAQLAESPMKTSRPLEELPRGVLVVCDEVGPQRYRTLAEACQAAKSGDVIELRYNGRREEVPISLSDLRLSIRSKENYQPVIVFKPSDTDPYNFPHNMFQLAGSGSALTLVNVAIELEMPGGDPSENWSLFEAQMIESLTLEKCLLTIKNASKNALNEFGAYHDKVSFIQLKSAPGADAMMPNGMMAVSPTEIRLEDCAARGEAVFLRNDDAQPARLLWKNGLLISSEWLLSAGGATNMPASSGGAASKLRVELSHLTAVTGQGLCRMWNTYSSPGLLDLDIRCTDSVLLTPSETASLIEQSCDEQPDASQRRIRWVGDRNVYGGYNSFWRIGKANSGAAPTAMPFEEWTAYWPDEVQPSMAPITWTRLPRASSPPHARTAGDYAIDDDLTNNEAIYETTDGVMVGVNATALPGWLWQADASSGADAASRVSNAEPPELD